MSDDLHTFPNTNIPPRNHLLHTPSTKVAIIFFAVTCYVWKEQAFRFPGEVALVARVAGNESESETTLGNPCAGGQPQWLLVFTLSLFVYRAMYVQTMQEWKMGVR